MKIQLFLITLFVTSLGFSQDLLMQNGSFDQCSGVFYDSGGEFAGYGNDEAFVITICPDTAGFMVQLNFTEFVTQLNIDVMTIYNGEDVTATELGTYTGVTSPGFVTATPAINPSGCLTIAFESDGAASAAGWAADISCLEPCQTITAQIDSSVPAPDSEGAIKVCPGDDITLNGGGVFSNDNTGATYEWDFGDSNTATGQSVTHAYAAPGVYLVNLVVRDDNFSSDPSGCASVNTINQIVQVGTRPDFTGTEALDAILCYGDSTTITGSAVPTEFIYDCSPSVGSETALPDGNGVSYTSGTIVENCYDDAEVIVDGSQIAGVCLNMEHSFSGDLDIFLTSPNGVQVQLFAQAGGGTYFGGADNNDNGVPGVGADYCFSMNATTLLQNANTVIAGSNPPNQSWEPGTYLPVGNFDDFIGSPINGDWTITITDNIPIDDGTIFFWSLAFDPSLQPPLLSFMPEITAEAWDADPTITAVNGNEITVTPPNEGQYCYTYRVSDDFGCEYTEEVCIEVLPEIVTETPIDLFVCDTGAPPYNFNLDTNTAIVLASSSISDDLVVTYHNTLADAETDSAAIPETANYSGTDGEIIYMRVEYLNSGCYEDNVLQFTLNVSGQPTINPVADLVRCDDVSGDGFEEFNLSEQDAFILGAQPETDFIVTYHLSASDAELGAGVLPVLFTNTISPVQPIFVRVESVGDSSCYNASAVSVFDLVVNPRDDASFSVSPSCDGGSIDLPLVTPGGIFIFNPLPADGAVINPTSGEVTGGMPGATYTIEYTTVGLCPTSSSQTFSVLEVDDASFSMTPTCDGGSVDTPLASPGGTFSFNPLVTDGALIDPVSGDVTNGIPGATYTIEYITSGVCPSLGTYNLTVLELDNPDFELIPTCDGATAMITGDLGGVFILNPDLGDGAVIDSATGTITNGVSGTTYTVDYTTVGACPQTATETVTVNLTDDASFSVTPTCDGATVNGPLITPGGIFGFNPIPTDGAVIDATSGAVTGGVSGATYTIEYTTGGICPTTSIQTFNVLEVDDASFFVTPTCEGGITTVTGTLGGVFSFNSSPTDAAIIDAVTGDVTNATPGEIYSITYMTMGVCPNTNSVEFTVNPLPAIVLPTPLEVCDDGTPDGLVSIDLSVKDAEITGNNPGYLVSYHLTNLDAETGSNALVLPYTNVSNPQTVYVRVQDATTGCYITTSLDLEVAQAPVATVPDAFLYCDPDNDGFGVFDLTLLDAEITGGIPGLTVSYHETEVNAELGVNAIPNPTSYLNIEAPTQELYARVESSSIATDCASVVSVELVVEPTPQLVAPSVALEACDDISADGFAVFDLTVDLQDLLNGLDPANYDFSYYETQADADQDINAIVNPLGYTNTIANNQTIWIRVSDPNTLGSCYSLTSLALQVNPLPVLVQPTPLALCDDLGEVPGDGLRVFDLTEKDPEITGGNGSWIVVYYETALDAQTQTNAIADPTQYSNTSIDGLPSNPQTLYVVVTNPDTGCINSTTLTLRVLPNPTPTPSASLPELELCDTINTGDGVEAFDLTLNEDLIRNGEFGVTVSYYETQDDAASGTNAIADPSQYSNISATQIIYVRVTNDDTGCYALVEFTIRLNPLPEVIAVSDVIQCELNTDGQDSFMLSSKDAEVLNGQDPSTYVVSYHVSASEAALGINALQSPYTNVSNPQTIYVAITNTNTGCAISTPQFNIQVDEAAQANPDGEVIVYELCDDALETDGDPSNDSVQFELSTQDQAILDGQDPANYQVRYYATLEGAELGVDPLPNLYENISNPQTIYARVDNNTLGVIPIALDLSALTSGLDFNADGIIDTYDTDGDGVLDLIDINGDGFSDAIDANGDGLYEYIDTNGDGLPDPVDLNNDGIFDNQQDNSICYSVASLILQVNSLPNFSIAESYIRCINTNGTEVIPPLVIDTELSATAYSFVWTLNGEVIPDAQGPTLTPNAAGLYTVTVSDISSSLVTSCSLSAQTEVLDSAPPVLTAEVVTQAFANTHVIEAIAEGLGEYEYSLDDGPWQDSGSFTDVSAGTHEVIARDKNGCGITRVSVFVLDYPLYFTPNGDGTNELWQISGIGNSAKIYIFDRYGKLLKQLSPSGPGWDGTYNGNIMPSSDYWFIVEYDEPATGERKEYKAHFTLKR